MEVVCQASCDFAKPDIAILFLGLLDLRSDKLVLYCECFLTVAINVCLM
jgi:hypothetical protein